MFKTARSGLPPLTRRASRCSPRVTLQWAVPISRLFFALVLASLLESPLSARAEPDLMQHRPLVRGFGGLCDGGPLVCTRIDKLALHAGADPIILPSTSLRATGLFASYGFSLGLLEHLEGGIFSSTAVWGQPRGSQTDPLWQQGPLRFAVKGLLWPFRANPHQQLAVLLDFEYEARLPHFDGHNQLGLLTDLAALRAVGNLPLGLAEVGLSAGALFDGQLGYATPELGARVGVHLPFLTATKVFAEGLARGFAVWQRTPDPLPGALIRQKPIVPGGALAFGLATRPRRQVELAVVAHVGFGEVAPFFLTLRGPLDFSLGEGYPYPRSLVVDLLREVSDWIAEQRRKLPTPLQQTCFLYGRDEQPVAALGQLTADGEHCEFQGQRFRIGDTLYPDPEHRRVCLDPAATHCEGAAPATSGTVPDSAAAADSLTSPSAGAEPARGGPPQLSRLSPAQLQRLLSQGALGPIRGELDNRCILNEGEHQVSPIGHLSLDGKHCVVERPVNIIRNGRKLRTQVQQVPIPIGQPIFRDPVTGRVCLGKNTKRNKDCPAVLDPAHNRPLPSATEAGYHGALAGTEWARSAADKAQAAAHLLTHPAELTTAARRAEERAEQAGKAAVETLRDPTKARQAAHAAWDSTLDTAHAKWEDAVHFYNLPTQKKINSLAEGGVKGALDIGTTVVVGAVIPGGGTGLKVAEELESAKAAHGLEGAVSNSTKQVRAAEGVQHSLPQTPHASLRRTQAAAGDVNRQVGDVNRVIRDGRLYRDTESGHFVRVNGDRVVITTPDGKQVTQFKNSRANTQKRVLNGKWDPIED